MRAFDFVVLAFGPAAQPLDFRVHAVFERFLTLALRVEIFLLRFEERAVISVDAQKAVLIHARQLDHLGGDIFEEIAVVADHDAGEGRVLQKSFEPVDPREVQMIGGLVEQQNVRALHQSFGNRQALAPAARQRRCRSIEVRKTCAAQRFGGARSSLRLRDFRPFECGFDHGSNRRAGGKLGYLRDQTQPRALANGHFPGVRLHAAVKNFEQCRLARTVRPDQADAFPFGNRERNVLE